MRYRTKPSVVEAVQYLGYIGARYIWSDIPDWLLNSLLVRDIYYEDEYALVETNGETFYVSAGDYIVLGVDDKPCICKKDIFERAYEAIK